MPVVFVLLGMGGCGKSQLALEYCYQAEHNRKYSAIFWIDATSPVSVQQSFTTVAQAMSKPDFSVADDEGNLQFVRHTLSAWQGRWLLVFDNFDDPKSFRPKSINEYFPRGSKGAILVTSRHEEAKGLSQYHADVSTMSNNEALELLFRRSEIDRNEENVREGESIVKRLGFHALAIHQAGAYILARNLDIKLYLTHYNSRMEKVLIEVPDLWDYRRNLKDNPEVATKLTAFTTWELSFDLITGDDKTREEKEHILTLMAYFDSKEISDTLFTPYAIENCEWMTSCIKDNVWSTFEFQDILKELRNLSLLQSLRIQPQRASFSLHPLIQDWIKSRTTSESRKFYTIEAILVLATFLRSQDKLGMSFEAKQTSLAHVDTVLLNKQKYIDRDYCLENINILDATAEFAIFLGHQGRYIAAEEVCRLALEGREILLGIEHYDTLTSMNNLAMLLDSQGKFEEAEPISRHTLALSEKVLGKEHPNTLSSVFNLAALLEKQNNLAEAEDLFRRDLYGCEITYGPTHNQTKASLQHLTALLKKRGKRKEAKAMEKRLRNMEAEP